MSGRYILRKFGQAVLTIIAIVLLNFLIFRMMPGSPERVLLRNPFLTQEKIEQVRKEWGLDKPLVPDQLVGYVKATVTADLGYSLKFRGQSVVEVIGSHLWPTVILVGLAEAIAIVVGLVLGSYAGWRRGSTTDRVGSGAGLILYSMPYFVIGMPLIIIFAANLGWFPTSGMLTPGATFQSAPAQLGKDARKLGMGPAAQFGFLSLEDSVVIESGDK